MSSSREKDDERRTPTHQPLLSSLVVRPTNDSPAGSDYEPGEVRPYSNDNNTTTNNQGYRMRAGSASPDRRRNGSREYSPDYENSVSPPRDRGFGRGRDSGRYRDYSPPHHGRGRFGGGRFGGGRFGGGRFYGGRFGGGRFIGGRFGGGRFGGRFDGGPMGAGYRGDIIPKNNPNVRPREGDWMCTDPACNNLNFARRDSCNNCHRPRYAPPGSPRRGYPGPPLMPRRFPGPPMDRSPGRSFNGYRSPPRGFGRDGPRDFGIAGPHHPRHEGRFPNRDHHRPDYFDDDMRDRNRFDRPMPPPLEWGRDRKMFDRRPPLSPPGLPSPPPAARGGRWIRDERERSRSPIRSPIRSPPAKEYRRDAYVDRGRDERRGVSRDPY
ncbi:hypothetical protein CTI12_AA031770 [Artemisia annua]|uniref:RanBP2-type domain-containing protein n=1 Tax=Artemisia annua TaxID=35608 RepID=A0A2U1QGR2_ARTAN|nr:hypothetical protein CTI12_AA031770 [Artemisia annua]